jgi:hypothetical protein
MAAHRVLAAGGKARGGGDGGPSATTSNAAYGRNDPVPSGFGRRGAVCYVAAPRRCPASPSSRRLAYGPTASQTRPLIFPGQAPRSGLRRPAQPLEHLVGGRMVVVKGKDAVPPAAKT